MVCVVICRRGSTSAQSKIAGVYSRDSALSMPPVVSGVFGVSFTARSISRWRVCTLPSVTTLAIVTRGPSCISYVTVKLCGSCFSLVTVSRNDAVRYPLSRYFTVMFRRSSSALLCEYGCPATSFSPFGTSVASGIVVLPTIFNSRTVSRGPASTANVTSISPPRPSTFGVTFTLLNPSAR